MSKVGKRSLTGPTTKALNDLQAGAGNEINQALGELASRLDALGGHTGSVTLHKQTQKDSLGKTILGLDLKGGRAGNAAEAIDDDDLITLAQHRRLTSCENLIQILEDCADDAQFIQNVKPPPPDPGDGGPPPTTGTAGCSPLTFEEDKSIHTGGLKHIETIAALNEYVYVAGLDGVTPRLQVYRVKANGGFVLISTLAMSQEIRRFVLHGGFIFGCRDGADGKKLISIDASNPWSLSQAGTLDVGFAAQGLDAIGTWVFVVGGTSDIASVDISNPAVMRKVN